MESVPLQHLFDSCEKIAKRSKLFSQKKVAELFAVLEQALVGLLDVRRKRFDVAAGFAKLLHKVVIVFEPHQVAPLAVDFDRLERAKQVHCKLVVRVRHHAVEHRRVRAVVGVCRAFVGRRIGRAHAVGGTRQHHFHVVDKVGQSPKARQSAWLLESRRVFSGAAHSLALLVNVAIEQLHSELFQSTEQVNNKARRSIRTLYILKWNLRFFFLKKK